MQGQQFQQVSQPDLCFNQPLPSFADLQDQVSYTEPQIHPSFQDEVPSMPILPKVKKEEEVITLSSDEEGKAK